jgi:hypothetical protein
MAAVGRNENAENIFFVPIQCSVAQIDGLLSPAQNAATNYNFCGDFYCNELLAAAGGCLRGFL